MRIKHDEINEDNAKMKSRALFYFITENENVKVPTTRVA
jgi:hypothetical protein